MEGATAFGGQTLYHMHSMALNGVPKRRAQKGVDNECLLDVPCTPLEYCQETQAAVHL